MTMRMPETKTPYHEMTEEERREAWASLRQRRAHQARRHHRSVIAFSSLTVVFMVLGILLWNHGYRYAGFFLWIAVGFAGFAVIAFIRNMVGSITTRKDDLTPPGF
jgi:uncharacterized membrane protein YdfJ with MMPL/SSD domain